MSGLRIANATKLKIVLAFMFGPDKSVKGVAAATGLAYSTCANVIDAHLNNLANPE